MPYETLQHNWGQAMQGLHPSAAHNGPGGQLIVVLGPHQHGEFAVPKRVEITPTPHGGAVVSYTGFAGQGYHTHQVSAPGPYVEIVPEPALTLQLMVAVGFLAFTRKRRKHEKLYLDSGSGPVRTAANRLRNVEAKLPRAGKRAS